MPRTITNKVRNAIQETVTRPRRLVELTFPSATLRLAAGEGVVWGGATWRASGVETANVREAKSGAEKATVVLPNLDRSASALVLTEPVRDSRCRIWQLYGEPPYAAADPVLLFDGYVSEVPEIVDTQVRLECRSYRTNAGESPSVPVYPYLISEALSAETVITWGEVELTLEVPK